MVVDKDVCVCVCVPMCVCMCVCVCVYLRVCVYLCSVYLCSVYLCSVYLCSVKCVCMQHSQVNLVIRFDTWLCQIATSPSYQLEQCFLPKKTIEE